MCGIAGIFQLNNRTVDRETIGRITRVLCHRGPDSEGLYTDNEMALGHRRLSIIDLSEVANQPMEDASGRYVIVFNGEIYNYREVKQELADYPYRSNGDTEVILAAYIRWGPGCLARLRGMFSIVIWDRKERELFIARDPLGVKPLYYFHDDNQFSFASEQRALLSVTGTEMKIDRVAIAEYFRYQSIPYPFSPVAGIRQVKAGTWMRVGKTGISFTAYWEPAKLHNQFDITDRSAVQKKIRGLMIQSVQRRLVSDVPVAAFLSGGIDSSAIVGLMAEAGGSPPRTFNISFDEKQYDESEYARLIARKFNTEHTELRISPSAMLDELTNALDAMDVPSGDGINTYVISKAIRKQGITVALSGVGGDELFAGYPIFSHYIRLQNQTAIWKAPGGLRRLAAGWLRNSKKYDRIGQLLHLPAPGIEHSYPVFRQLLSDRALAKLTTLPLTGRDTLANQLLEQAGAIALLPWYSQVTAAEYMGYTQQTLLKDMDQMSMANSLELREPFFDQDLVEFVMSVPDHFKAPVYPKSLLVESLKPLLPDEIVHRKKQGFLFPWNQWMRRELKSFCSEKIQAIAQRDFIRGDRLKLEWLHFLAGDKSIRWQEMWLFVVLEYWLGKNGLS